MGDFYAMMIVVQLGITNVMLCVILQQLSKEGEYEVMCSINHAIAEDAQTRAEVERDKLRAKLERVEANLKSWDDHSATDEERGVAHSFRAALAGETEGE